VASVLAAPASKARSSCGAAARPPSVRVGKGTARCHHGEILQGVFEFDGRLRRGLVSLFCPFYRTEATISLGEGQGGVQVDPPWKEKARRAAEVTLQELGAEDVPARLVVTSPIPVCLGFGSSTSDVTATIFAVADALGVSLDRPQVARLAVRIEIASDPLMYGHALLFAQREGEVLEDFDCSLPRMEVVGFKTRDGGGIDTVALRPAASSSWESEAFRPLLGLLRRSLCVGSVADLGRVASASARLNQNYLPIPLFAAIEEVANDTGAAGIQVAHSGNIAGILFDPADLGLERRIARAQRRLHAFGIERPWRFTAGGNDSVALDAAA
jgi:uncharacterized protein involved in propanediol utilization